MRGVVSLQLGLGLVALFAVPYLTADRLMAPIESAQLERAARAEAMVAAERIAASWDGQREAARSVVRTMARTPAFRGLGSTFNRSARKRALNNALRSVVRMSGGRGQAVLLDSAGRPVVPVDGAKSLIRSEAAQAALQGQSMAVVQKLDDRIALVVGAPVPKRRSGDAKEGALLLSIPLRAEPALLKSLPGGVGLQVRFDEMTVFKTLSGDDDEALAKVKTGTVELDGRRYGSVRRRLLHDGQTPLELVALAAFDAPGTVDAAAHVQTILALLGAGALLIVLAGLALRGAPAAAAVPAATARAKDTANTADLDHVNPAPVHAATPVLDLKLGSSGSPSTRPMNPTPLPVQLETEAPTHAEPSFVPPPTAPPAGPLLEAPEHAPPIALPSDNPFDSSVSAAFDGPGPYETPPPPDPALRGSPEPPPPPPDAGHAVHPVALPPSAENWARMPPDSPVFSQKTLPAHQAPDAPRISVTDADRAAPGGSPGLPPAAPPPLGPAASSPFEAVDSPPFAPPQPGGNFKEPTPFDAIASAIFAPPQEPVEEQRTDLPVPKGPVPPELKAAQQADAQRRGFSQPPVPLASSEPTDLPMPKDLPMPRPSFQTADLGLLPGETADLASTNGDTGRTGGDPWQNPSVPRMQAPTAPPSGPQPFDEGHYRSVFEEFVASKQRLGEATDSLTYEGFRNKLRSSEENLLDRHGCRAVRFQVLVKDRTVSLRPQLVR